MAIELGTHVRTSDDQDLGSIDRLILDPESGTVRAAVVRKGLFLPRDVEVQIEDLHEDAEGNARLTLRSDEVDSLPAFHAANYTVPPPGYGPPLGYPVGMLYWPVGFGAAGVPDQQQPAWAINDPAVAEEVGAALRQEDLENAVVTEGSEVWSRDEQKVGHVHRLSFDPESGALSEVVVRSGFLFTTDTALPARLIDEVGNGLIRLRVDAAMLRR
jgi:uncharacterized protein YrrD